jgi:hypothetical protein
MKYTVVWRKSAEQQLAHLWTTAADRNAVKNAADTIDSVLTHDPDRRASRGQAISGS